MPQLAMSHPYRVPMYPPYAAGGNTDSDLHLYGVETLSLITPGSWGEGESVLLLRLAEGDGALVGGVDGFGKDGAQAAFLHLVDRCRARAAG